MQPLRVVICEDHNLTIDGLRVLISANPNFVVSGQAHNQKELFLLLQESTPDILIMDINLGKENGLDLIKLVKTNYHSTRVLVLSMYDDPSMVNKAKENKANGYITKSSSSQELMDALQGVMGDSFYESKEAKERRLNGFKKRDEFIEKMRLTKREVEILNLMGKGLVTELIGDKLFLSVHTVRTHKKNIMKKLGLSSTSEMVRYAIENNLVDDNSN